MRFNVGDVVVRKADARITNPWRLYVEATGKNFGEILSIREDNIYLKGFYIALAEKNFELLELPDLDTFL